MKINISRLDILWNYLGIVISLTSNIIWLPVIVYYLSADIVGVWYIFVSIGMIVTLLDFGFAPQISRVVAYSWSGAVELQSVGVSSVEGKKDEPNYELLHMVMKICKVLYLGIGVIALFFMLTGGTWYIKNLIIGLDVEMVYSAWLVYAISIFLNIYIGYYSVVLRGIGDLEHMSQANIIAKFAMIFIGVSLLILGAGIIGLAVANLISGFLQRYLCKRFLRKHYNLEYIFKNIHIKYKYTYKYVMNALWHNAWRDGLVTIAGYLNNQAMILICGTFFTLSETGVYSLSLQIAGAILGIAAGVSSSYMPSLQSSWVNKDQNMAVLIVSRSLTAYYIIAVVGIVCFLVIGVDIISWIKSEFIIDKMFFACLSVYMFFLSRHQLAAAYISTMNELPYAFSFMVSSLGSVVAALIMMRYGNIGIYGLIIGPFLVQSCYNNWKWNTYINNQLNHNEWNMIKIGFTEYTRFLRDFCSHL